MRVTADNLPAVIADEQHDLLSAENAGAYMEASLSRAIMWLADVERIEEVIHQKAAAEAITTFIREKELGHDAELHGAEIVRRCERRIGQLVRLGQEQGDIAKPGDAGGPRGDYVRKGEVVHVRRPRAVDTSAISPRNYLPEAYAARDTYAVTDGVSDEEFNEALTDARAEGNLSRANVVRKVKARKGEPAPELEGRNEWHRKRRRIDSNRIVAESVTMLDGIVSGLALVEADTLDGERLGGWAASLRENILQLRHFLKELETHV